jgi:hypothetical protein
MEHTLTSLYRSIFHRFDTGRFVMYVALSNVPLRNVPLRNVPLCIISTVATVPDCLRKGGRSTGHGGSDEGSPAAVD